MASKYKMENIWYICNIILLCLENEDVMLSKISQIPTNISFSQLSEKFELPEEWWLRGAWSLRHWEVLNAISLHRRWVTSGFSHGL